MQSDSNEHVLQRGEQRTVLEIFRTLTIDQALHPEIETFVSDVGCVKSMTFGWYIVFDEKYQALRGMSGEGNLAVDVTVPGMFGCKSQCLGRSDEAANFSVVKLRSLVHVLMGGENITITRVR